MKENLSKSIEELKRSEHLVYVSLKYTRTGEVFYNIIKRLMSSLEYLINAILVDAHESNLIDKIPKSPIKKADTVLALYKDDQKILRIVEQFRIFRTLLKSEYSTKNDFRRHLTAYFVLEDGVFEVNIDNITEMHEEIKALVFAVQKYLMEKSSADK